MEAERPGGTPGAERQGGRAPARPPAEIVGDLERERKSLVEAVDQLKGEMRSTRDRILSPRTLAIAAAPLVLLVALRRWRKARRTSGDRT